MVILLVNWIGTRAPSEASGKKRKRGVGRTKRKSRFFFSSGKMESYVRTKRRMKIRVQAEMNLRRNRRICWIFLFHVCCWFLVRNGRPKKCSAMCMVYGLFILSSLSVRERGREGKKWSDRGVKGSLFVFKQLYERYLVVEIFFCLLFISGNIYIKRD